MTLFSIVWKNMKGNFNNYLIYFISLVFSIIIYYTFVSLQYSEEILDTILGSASIAFLFMASSVVLLIFVAIFILYSNSFFIRYRKREVGLYSLLGLRKKTIGKMLFYESLMMGVISLVIGILLGSFLSKLFAMILVKLMNLTVEVNFSISIEAILQTVIVFMVIILFTSIQGYRLIYRFKLIELFHAEKKGEQSPKVSLPSAMIGIIFLIISYCLILRPIPDELSDGWLYLNYSTALVLLIIGTQLFFSSVTVYLLKLVQKNKNYYYKGTSLIETAQLIHRIRGNARTFTVIALLSAFTISLFGAAYSGYFGSNGAAEVSVPFSYTHLSQGTEFDTEIENIIQADREHPIIAQVDIPVIEVQGELLFELDYSAEPFKVISESTFYQASKALGNENTIALSENEVVVIQPRLTEFTDADFKGNELSLQLAEESQKLTIIDMVEGSILPFDYPDFFVVVTDELFIEFSKQIVPLVYKAYEVEGEDSAEATSLKLSKLTKEHFQASSIFYFEHREVIEGNALDLFILGFLGLVFLVATGSILYFKQLSEANEVKSNYEILSKIGVSKKEVRNSINKQTLFVFGLPLTVGIVHASAILHSYSSLVSNLTGVNLLIPIFTAMVAFVVIYTGYYVLTVNMYNNIVNK